MGIRGEMDDFLVSLLEGDKIHGPILGIFRKCEYFKLKIIDTHFRKGNTINFNFTLQITRFHK